MYLKGGHWKKNKKLRDTTKFRPNDDQPFAKGSTDTGEAAGVAFVLDSSLITSKNDKIRPTIRERLMVVSSDLSLTSSMFT